MNQTIQDGISDRWVGKASVPLSNGHLSGHQCRRTAVAIIQDLEQVLRLGSGQRISEPVIEDQELDTGEGIQELRVGAVSVGESGLVQEAGGALVLDIEVLAAGGGGRRGGQPPVAGGRLGRKASVLGFGPGGYRFADQARAGALLTVLLLVVSMILLPLFP